MVIPRTRRRNADRNWSMERGSLALFSCMLGLHTPWSQNLAIFNHYNFLMLTPWSPAEPLQVSILLVFQQHVIEPCFVFRVVRKCQTVARHSWPCSDLKTRKNVEELITWRSLDKVLISDLEQSALIILGHEIAQHCPVINKGVQLTENENVVFLT